MRCVAQIYSAAGRRRRCDNEATHERNAAPVCAEHTEPAK